MESRESLRLHRHDIMNHLQLVKGYLQLGNSDKALYSLNRCADWLISLSQLQAVLPNSAEEFLWTAHTCQHLLIEWRLSESLGVLVSGQASNTLCSVMEWLEQTAIEHNMEKLTVILEVGPVDSEDVCVRVLTESPVLSGRLEEGLASAFPDLRCTVEVRQG